MPHILSLLFLGYLNFAWQLWLHRNKLLHQPAAGPAPPLHMPDPPILPVFGPLLPSANNPDITDHQAIQASNTQHSLLNILGRGGIQQNRNFYSFLLQIYIITFDISGPYQQIYRRSSTQTHYSSILYIYRSLFRPHFQPSPLLHVRLHSHIYTRIDTEVSTLTCWAQRDQQKEPEKLVGASLGGVFTSPKLLVGYYS